MNDDYDKALFEFFASQLDDDDQKKLLLRLFQEVETEKIIEELIDFSGHKGEA